MDQRGTAVTLPVRGLGEGAIAAADGPEEDWSSRTLSSCLRVLVLLESTGEMRLSLLLGVSLYARSTAPRIATAAAAAVVATAVAAEVSPPAAPPPDVGGAVGDVGGAVGDAAQFSVHVEVI